MNRVIGLVIAILLTLKLSSQNNFSAFNLKTDSLSNSSLLVNSAESTKDNISQVDFNNLSLKAYGVVNYYNYNWETDPEIRDAVDLERINYYMKYDFTDKISLKTEFEFEHCGSGVTMEFDKFEEFGEFESEIEAGGEVLIEQLNLLFNIKPWLNIRAGRLKLYLGISSKLDEATEYFTGYRSTMENTLLPLGWYEVGIEILGDLGKKKKWSYKAYLVNGLSSAGFSSGNWIKRGHQKRFETANAENFAFAGRFDYNLNNGGWIGVSGYHGNSNDNRPKPDLEDVEGYVSIVDIHANINQGPFKFHAMAMYGHLQNASLISEANRNLSNNLNVKRTPVASEVVGCFVETGADIFSIFNINNTNMLYLFSRYDYYDSMYAVSEDIFNNPRWERETWTFGINYFPHPNVVIKSHYAFRTLGIDEDNKENTFLLGVGFRFKTKNY